MDDLIYNKIKNKIDKLEHKQQEKDTREREKLRKSTEKIYYKIWKLIIINIKKEKFYIKMYVKPNTDIVTELEIEDSFSTKTYSSINLVDLIAMFEMDGLELKYSYTNMLNKRCYIMEVSKYKLKDIIEKEKINKKTL